MTDSTRINKFYVFSILFICIVQSFHFKFNAAKVLVQGVTVAVIIGMHIDV